MTNTQKIILNWLPPSSVYIPSAAMSILKSHMAKHGYETQVIYWNILLQSAMAPFPAEEELSRLIPFLAILAKHYGDKTAEKRLAVHLQSLRPESKTMSGSIERHLEMLSNTALKIINQELDKIPFDDIGLFGISCQFDQWISGMVLAQEIKKRNSKLTIVVGGLGDKDAARQMLEICSNFDYAIWGEGEYPLLKLCQSLQEKAENFKEIPRLVYRSNNGIIDSEVTRSDYLKFEDYPMPLYEEYFTTAKGRVNIKQIKMPVNTSRGCSWNRCNFCRFNAGYKYRERDPDKVIKEIDYLHQTYGVERFIFVDNDIVGRDKEKFIWLLDGLIGLSSTKEAGFQFIGEVIPTGFNASLIKKMILAGFELIHIGYEAVTDGLLEKMNKRNRLADNILFLKFLTKYGANAIAANIIPDIPDETEDDVLESIDNLHYLRFFLADDPKTHSISQFRMSKGSPYFNKLPEKSRGQWRNNPAAYLFPSGLYNDDQRFDLFDFQGAGINNMAWMKFYRANEFYKKNCYRYTIMVSNDTVIYQEYLNDLMVSRVVFDQPEYWEVLKEANDRVVSLENLMTALAGKYPGMTEQMLRTILEDLRKAYLIYSDKMGKAIISIIDTSNVI